jgi:hypothetical protein
MRFLDYRLIATQIPLVIVPLTTYGDGIQRGC